MPREGREEDEARDTFLLAHPPFPPSTVRVLLDTNRRQTHSGAGGSSVLLVVHLNLLKGTAILREKLLHALSKQECIQCAL